MRNGEVRLAGLVLLAGLGVLAGCGTPAPPGRRDAATPAPGGTSMAAAPPSPSAAATMICAKQEQGEVAEAAGLTLTGPATAAWVRPVFTCTYPSRAGKLVLSVRELAGPAETTTYFNSALAAAGGSTDVPELGEGAFAIADGSVYVRKQFKVLKVDVGRLPASIGSPPISRARAAVRVAEVIMGCWTGD